MEINAVGLACPKPVILAKKHIRSNPSQALTIYVDNEIATQNLTKLALQLHLHAKTTKLSNDRYSVEISPTSDSNTNSEENTIFNIPDNENTCKIMDDFSEDYIVIISSDEMGKGDELFSKTLLEGFLYALCEQDLLPKYILFYNKGVTLTTINENTLKDLKSLEQKGVEVLSCGMCLDHYNLKEKLGVGSITNMYRICELMSKYRNVMPC